MKWKEANQPNCQINSIGIVPTRSDTSPFMRMMKMSPKKKKHIVVAMTEFVLRQAMPHSPTP